MNEEKSISQVIPDTSERVNLSTSEKVNANIRSETIKRLNEIGDDPEKIKARLSEIESEWDVERTLETNASIATLAGLALGSTVNKKWFLLPAVVAGFLFQHAVQGWCPPLPIFRRLGIRTQREIDNERSILLARLGELKKLEKDSAEQALDKLEKTVH